jgi:uncharacterized membrane protein
MSFNLSAIEGAVVIVVSWLKLGVEIFGATLVTRGVCAAIRQLVRSLAADRPAEFTATRLILARHLALALEFELGADILGTAISPNWDQIGKLGAMAAIRTGPNYFLSRELQRESPAERSKTDTEGTAGLASPEKFLEKGA